MNAITRNSLLALTIAGTLTLVACKSDDAMESSNMPPPASAPMESGMPPSDSTMPAPMPPPTDTPPPPPTP